MDEKQVKKVRIQDGQRILVFNLSEQFKFSSDLNVIILNKPVKKVDSIFCLFAI